MDKCLGQIALSKEEAVANLLSRIDFSPISETVKLDKAAGRVAARDYHALQTLPSIKSAAKDGIAVHSSAFASGMPDTSSWQEGRDYIHCYTGVGIHGDFDAVIMIENIDFDSDGRLLLDPVELDPDLVALPGRIIKTGEHILSRGEQITPYYLSRLAAGGHIRIEVLKKPVVAFIPTGNELVKAGEAVPDGMNVDTNSLMFGAKMREFCAVPLLYDIVPDDPVLIAEKLEDALGKADIIAINGGSSKGLHDYTVEVVEQKARILSHMIKSGPGSAPSQKTENLSWASPVRR